MSACETWVLECNCHVTSRWRCFVDEETAKHSGMLKCTAHFLLNQPKAELIWSVRSLWDSCHFKCTLRRTQSLLRRSQINSKFGGDTIEYPDNFSLSWSDAARGGRYQKIFLFGMKCSCTTGCFQKGDWRTNNGPVIVMKKKSRTRNNHNKHTETHFHHLHHVLLVYVCSLQLLSTQAANQIKVFQQQIRTTMRKQRQSQRLLSIAG